MCPHVGCSTPIIIVLALLSSVNADVIETFDYPAQTDSTGFISGSTTFYRITTTGTYGGTGDLVAASWSEGLATSAGVVSSGGNPFATFATQTQTGFAPNQSIFVGGADFPGFADVGNGGTLADFFASPQDLTNASGSSDIRFSTNGPLNATGRFLAIDNVGNEVWTDLFALSPNTFATHVFVSDDFINGDILNFDSTQVAMVSIEFFGESDGAGTVSSYQFDVDNLAIQSVPEPNGMVGIGLIVVLGLATARFRRRLPGQGEPAHWLPIVRFPKRSECDPPLHFLREMFFEKKARYPVVNRLKGTGSSLMRGFCLCAVGGWLAASSAPADVVDFDAIDTSGGQVTGAAIDTYLAGFGITVANEIPTTFLRVGQPSQMDADVVLVSQPNYLAQWWNGVNGTSFDLIFDRPLANLSVSIPQIVGSTVLVPEWQLSALDGNGNLLTTSYQGAMAGSPFPRRTFTFDQLTDPDLQGFRVFSNVHSAAGQGGIPIDDILFTTIPEPSTAWIVTHVALCAPLGLGRHRFQGKGKRVTSTQQTEA